MGKLITIEQIAGLVGVKPTTIRVYHSLATRRRREGIKPLPGDMPAPDQRFGVIPVWDRATITEWISRRPGQGVGGGRPRMKDHGQDD